MENIFRVVVAPRIHQSGLDLLASRSDVRYEVVEDVSEASLKRAFADADGVVIRAMPIANSVFETAKRLKIVSRHGVGYNNVDVDYLTKLGIPLALTIDANALSVAEQTLFFLLTLAKNGLVYDRATRENRFGVREGLNCFDISGKTLLIVGFGRIGRMVAERAKAFGMKVAVSDPMVAGEAIVAAGCSPVASLAEGLPRADFLTVHSPLTNQTKAMIGAAELALMRPSACVINTARGGIVDEKALTTALTAGRLRAAALDVFETEPPAPDNPLFALDNVILSPHSAGLTVECAERMAIASVENVLATFDGRLDPAVVVNRQVLGSPKSARVA
jgi:D-3-phosphoglycerate dehydrogenase / 2-oxoglutarate reductase